MDDTITLPDGTAFTVLERPADPETGPLVMEFLIQPDAPAPPPHVHGPGQTETFTVTEGRFELLTKDGWRELAAGGSYTVSAGEAHTFRNRSGAPVRIHNVHDPAHSFERYLRRLAALVTERGIDGMSPRAALYLSVLWADHRDTIRPAGVPQRLAMDALGVAGRLLRVSVPG